MGWLEEEERIIKREMRRKAPPRFNRLYLFLLFVLAALGALPQLNFIYSSPTANMLFPDTWICKKCGYDNYEGIKTCSVCGTPRKK